ncbi:MAG: tetratricopeptide repeat protein [Pyrinomonadaceae bacterium]
MAYADAFLKLHLPVGVRLLIAVACCYCALPVLAQQQRPADAFSSGLSLFREGRFEEAAKQFSGVVNTQADANLFLGKALINLGRFKEAEVPLKRFITAERASDEGYYLLGFALFRQGQAKESLAIYQQAANLKAPTSDDFKIIGLNFGLLNDLTRSAEYLERAVALDPHNLEARYYLGRVRFTQNFFEQARIAFEEVLRRNPLHSKSQNNLGQVYEAQNDQARAIQAYRRAIELDHTSAKPSELPFLNLATLLFENGKLEEALPLLARAALINQTSPKVRFQLGKTLQRLGRLAEAEKEFVAATQLDPSDPGPRYVLGQLYRKLGKTELARQELEISERLRSGKKL